MKVPNAAVVALAVSCALPACQRREAARTPTPGDSATSGPLSNAPPWLAHEIDKRITHNYVGMVTSTCPAGTEPSRWSLIAAYQGSWNRANGDTIDVRLTLHVVGDVQVREGGYRSYFITKRLTVDTARFRAVPAAQDHWAFICERTRTYIAFRALADPGMYIDSAEFSRLARLVDSIAPEPPRAGQQPN